VRVGEEEKRREKKGKREGETSYSLTYHPGRKEENSSGAHAERKVKGRKQPTSSSMSTSPPPRGEKEGKGGKGEEKVVSLHGRLLYDIA